MGKKVSPRAAAFNRILRRAGEFALLANLHGRPAFSVLAGLGDAAHIHA